MLRLKGYTAFMFRRYLQLLETTKHPEFRTSEDKLVLASFVTTGETVLFFNQSEPESDFLDWSNNPDVPVSYQLKINHCVCLLVDSAFWCLSSSIMAIENFPENSRFWLDLTNFRIEETDENKDVLTKQFFQTCNLVHRVCPQNTRLREGLIRLIWAYIMAKELTAEARDLSSLDRLTYLKQLTNYIP